MLILILLIYTQNFRSEKKLCYPTRLSAHHGRIGSILAAIGALIVFMQIALPFLYKNNLYDGYYKT